MKDIKVDVRIASVRSSTGENWVSMRIEDKESGIQFLNVRFTHEQFGLVMSGNGLYGNEAVAEIGGLQYIGKRHEHVSEMFDTEHEADLWCQRQLKLGWDQASARKNNTAKWVAISRRYVEVDS